MASSSTTTTTLFDRLRLAFDRIRQELVRGAKILRLKKDTAVYQQNRRATYQKLGEETYKLLKESRFNPTEVEKLLSEIDRLSAQIGSCKSEIDVVVRGMKTPPQQPNSATV